LLQLSTQLQNTPLVVNDYMLSANGAYRLTLQVGVADGGCVLLQYSMMAGCVMLMMYSCLQQRAQMPPSPGTADGRLCHIGNQVLFVMPTALRNELSRWSAATECHTHPCRVMPPFPDTADARRRHLISRVLL
jgi:hypothetical protein